MSKPESPAGFRPEESPPAWFVELCLAVDRGDFARAAECQTELERLGWRVDRRKRRFVRKPKGGAQ